jgi:flagellar basal body-associated protein FliL
MTRNNTIRVVLITVLLILVIGAAGYALYRIGYSHGVAAVDSDLPAERLFRGFGERVLPGHRFDGTSMFASRSVGFFPFFWGLPGLLLMVGIVTLAVVGFISLFRRQSSEPRQETNQQDT